MEGLTKNSVKNAQYQVTLVRLTAIPDHFILDIKCWSGWATNVDGTYHLFLFLKEKTATVVHRDKTFLEIQNTTQNPKTLPESLKHVLESKHFLKSQNTSKNKKYFPKC